MKQVWGKFDAIDPAAAIDFIDVNFAEKSSESIQGKSQSLLEWEV